MVQQRDLKSEHTGDDVHDLHVRLALLGLCVPTLEYNGSYFGSGTYDSVCRFQKKRGHDPTGVVDSTTATAISSAIDALTFQVSGHVTSPDRAAIGGLRVEIVDRQLDKVNKLAQAVTDDRGAYKAHFSARALASQGKSQPDLQARAYAGQTLVGSSMIRYNAGQDVTLDIALPRNVTALPSEYEALIAAIATQYTGKLGDLQESGERQDITYLANKIGWDARLIAMAAIADQLSAKNTPSIAAPLYYGLFRAGLPTDPTQLYQADAQSVATIWKRAIDLGVTPANLASTLATATTAFQTQAAAHIVDGRGSNSVSTVKELAQIALGSDAQKQQQFATIYAQNRNNWSGFWTAVRQAFGDALTNRLQLDGTLADVTLDNAPLIASLHTAEQSNTIIDLVSRGYYNPAKWAPLVAQATIPASITGDTADAKRANYAAMLAAQIKLRYPTAVLAAQVQSGEVPLATPSNQSAVQTFLLAHQDQFGINQQPIEQYLVRNKLVGQVATPVVEEIKRIQRAYQLTTSDTAMTGLLQNKIHSAYQIVWYEQTTFARTFGTAVGGQDVARQIWSRAVQIHGAVLNIASHYMIARTATPIGVHSPPTVIDQSPAGSGSSDLVAYPTLEKLFGSQDYCSCDDCQSILSPAAYLVDLLHLVDKTPPDNTTTNPQLVLFARRPDIQHLKLSCENTNTELPYIDIVNETLEYFVANPNKNSPPSLDKFTGFDTDPIVQPAELLATPQNVDDRAYAVLRATYFPMPLPFNKSLETLRRYFAKLGAPLGRAMEVMRVDDSIERANDASYAWRDILMEYLGLSREEYKLLTDQSVTVKHLYGYSDDDTDATIPTDLPKVATFAHLVNISYEDLVAILTTRFINPAAVLIPRVEALGVPFNALRDLNSGATTTADFGKLLPSNLDPTSYGGKPGQILADGSNYTQVMGQVIKDWLGANSTYDKLTHLITITNPSDVTNLCDASALELRYADPNTNTNALQPIDFVRLIRFIRLWRKLGWTIDQVDAALMALYPPDPSDGKSALDHLDAAFKALLPQLGILTLVGAALGIDLSSEFRSLLACWASIDTAGPNALYRAMFLNATLLAQDSAFADDGFGGVLGDKNAKLVDHVEALRAAFGLTSDEVTAIIAEVARDQGLHSADLGLDLANVSAVYRHGWLSRKLRLSVVEVLLLKQQTGLDPFAAPNPPAPQMLQFIHLIQMLAAASVRPTQALYWIWNQDISGKSAPNLSDVLALAATLRADFAAVEADFTVTTDPNGDIARARMALVYGAEVTDFFFGVLDSTYAVTAKYVRPPAASPQLLLAAAPGRVDYDDYAKQISFFGYLDATTKTALVNAAGADPDMVKGVNDLATANDATVGALFRRFPELLAALTKYDTRSADTPEQKRTTMLTDLLPELKQARKREQALAAVAASARTDLVLVTSLLSDQTVLGAAANPGSIALEDLTAFDALTAAAITTSWDGYLLPTDSGLFKFQVIADAGITKVTLTIDGVDAKMASTANVWSNGTSISLTAGALARFTLVTTGTGNVTVQWSVQGQGWVDIPAAQLFTFATVDALRTTYTRLLKIAALVTALKLTPDETTYFAARSDYQITGQPWFDSIPTSDNPTTAMATQLRDRLIVLLTFAQLKAALSPKDERVLQVVKAPATTLPNGDTLVASLAKWDDASITSILARFGKARADLSNVAVFQRLFDTFQLVGTFGIAATPLLNAITNNPDPTSTVVRDLASALRARYDATTWLAVIQPINDALRTMRRDALVACVLHILAKDPKNTVDTADRLFEYFLMDVEMDACMKTSRIRHALSSVQLFIERCLMNLEQPNVDPELFDPKQWDWMRRYRVWEANRKIFLWPENWLDEELRDDQSPIFKETMSELLQKDITDDAAEVAILNYLAKLEEVAKLEPCGVYLDTNTNVLHVIARTSGARRKYYYRKFDGGSWYPWEAISLEIEDNPVMPVVWNGRLLLFWIKLVKRHVPTAAIPDPSTHDLKDVQASDITPTSPQITVHAILQWSEYYNGKWQSAKTSDAELPAQILQGVSTPMTYDPSSFDRSTFSLGWAFETPARPVGEPDELRIFFANGLASAAGQWTSYLFTNTHSLPSRQEDVPITDAILFGNQRLLDTSLPSAATTFAIEFTDPKASTPSKENVLGVKFPTIARTVEPLQSLGDWNAPFFYADGRHVFFVTSTHTGTVVTDPNQVPFGPIDIAKWIDNIIHQTGIDPVVNRPGGDPEPGAQAADPNFNHVLTRTNTVQFGQATIGLAGSINAPSIVG